MKLTNAKRYINTNNINNRAWSRSSNISRHESREQSKADVLSGGRPALQQVGWWSHIMTAATAVLLDAAS